MALWVVSSIYIFRFLSEGLKDAARTGYIQHGQIIQLMDAPNAIRQLQPLVQFFPLPLSALRGPRLQSPSSR